MQALPITPLREEMMDVIDTETGERCRYSYRAGMLYTLPLKPVPPFHRPTPEREAGNPSLRALLHDLVLEKIGQSIQHHPFFWLCVCCLFH